MPSDPAMSDDAGRSPASDQVRKLTERLRGMTGPGWRSARSRLSRMRDDLRIEARSTAYRAQRYAHQRPWRVVAAAAAVSLLVGYLIGSLRRRPMTRGG